MPSSQPNCIDFVLISEDCEPFVTENKKFLTVGEVCTPVLVTEDFYFLVLENDLTLIDLIKFPKKETGVIASKSLGFDVEVTTKVIN